MIFPFKFWDFPVQMSLKERISMKHLSKGTIEKKKQKNSSKLLWIRKQVQLAYRSATENFLHPMN